MMCYHAFNRFVTTIMVCKNAIEINWMTLLLLQLLLFYFRCILSSLWIFFTWERLFNGSWKLFSLIHHSQINNRPPIDLGILLVAFLSPLTESAFFRFHPARQHLCNTQWILTLWETHTHRRLEDLDVTTKELFTQNYKKLFASIGTKFTSRLVRTDYMSYALWWNNIAGKHIQ